MHTYYLTGSTQLLDTKMLCMTMHLKKYAFKFQILRVIDSLFKLYDYEVEEIFI